jgi:hypothetical protein
VVAIHEVVGSSPTTRSIFVAALVYAV